MASDTISSSKEEGAKLNCIWSAYNLAGLAPPTRTLTPWWSSSSETSNVTIPPYFWGGTLFNVPRPDVLGQHRGYKESRALVNAGRIPTLQEHCDEAISFLGDVFEAAAGQQSSSGRREGDSVVRLRLSPELQCWREEQHTIGRVLPPKGKGITRCSNEVLGILGASDWPPALLTSNALFGCGIADLLIGAQNASTLFSNYVADMAFYYEHGYHYVFPELEGLISKAQSDTVALQTLGAKPRRAAVEIGICYIQAKIAFEERHQAGLEGLSAVMPSRKAAQKVYLVECEVLGMYQESIERGYDAASAMNDMVFSSLASDVVDVGSDIFNSEVFNSLLNTADVTDTGEVSEHVLRRVYDAVSHCSARTLVHRWSEPTAVVDAALYIWHILNDRHCFLRRAVLGWTKAERKEKSEQREADFDEAFDERYHTTGLSRPLQGACRDGDMCVEVCGFLERHRHESMLGELWQRLVVDVVEYAAAGQVQPMRERELEESLRLVLVKAYVRGLVFEIRWLLAHASHHAWQVNRLFEAAMFGSLLDDASLAGKLDRAERTE